MEATKDRRKQRTRVEEEFTNVLEGSIPEAPKLEDFQEGRVEVDLPSLTSTQTSTSSTISDELCSNNVTPTPPSPPSTEKVNNYDTKVNVKVESIPRTSTAIEALEGDSNTISDLLSDTSSSMSVDPCEEALTEEAKASAPGQSQGQGQECQIYPPSLEEIDYHTHTQLYPNLPLTIDSSLPSMASLSTWENIPTPVHNSRNKNLVSSGRAATSTITVLSFELPVELCPAELDSKIQHLYSNMILESSEEKVREFLGSTGSKTSYPGFELYELISSYQRAYNQLTGCENSLSELRESCTTLEKGLWTVDYETLSQTSTCVDGNVVSASHKYLVAKFDKGIYSGLDKVLKGTKELVKDSFSLFSYSVALSRTQIQHFFHKSFKDINLQSFEVQGYYSGYPNGELQDCANLLRVAISTLFIFLRKGSTHPLVKRDCQGWLTSCVGLLLRIATLDDHLFVLNHILRLPPGMVGGAKGLASCVQIPKIPIPSNPEDYFNSGFSSLNLDYALTVLKLILNPVPQRDAFLKVVEVGSASAAVSGSNHDPWVVVDSDGEDSPDDPAFFKETDLISLLHQIPFESLFRRILLISKVQSQDVYDIRIASERNVLKLLAFGTQLVDILGQGFVAYYTDRYRQLVKMIGRLILHTTQYITDHIESLMSSEIGKDCGQKGSLIRKEYDIFFRNAVGILFSGKNIGTLQFLAAMPFHLISSEMLWHVYCAISKWSVNDHHHTDISSEFENELVSMNESDAFYLLTTLCSMATAREEIDANFTRIVTLHLFQIGFLSPLTRDCCSKTARDLLGNLTKNFRNLITVLLHTINSKFQIIETFSLYLLKELAFDLWIPTDMDMKLIFHWLVTFPASAIENQTARFVIQSMNWGFDVDGSLFLPFDMHYEVALMIMESTIKWEKSQNFISEGMKQMNPLTSKLQDNWAWEMCKRLHLHAFDRDGNPSQDQLQQILGGMPNFDSNPELECVRKGIEFKHPLACFLSLYLTPTGHSVPLVCSKGIDLIEVMLQNYRVEYVIHSLLFITPLFTECPEALHSIDKFRNILTVLLSTDMTYVRMAKNFITTDFPGEVTKMFGDMISAQINQCSRFGTDEKAVIGLWTECLTKLDGWNKDPNILYLLDILAKSSMTKEDCHSYFMQYFSDIYKNMPKSSQSGISSLFSWTTPATTLLPNPSYSQTPYFIYYLLTIEMEQENTTGFWKTLCVKLNNPKIALDAAVKKSSHISKLATSTNFLTIYRFAQLSLDLPHNHELVFLVWQKFFLRYFHRVSDNQTTQYSCVASRFFEGMINSAFYNKLRRKITELLSYCKENLTVFEQNLNSSENASENPLLVKELLMDKINLASALVLWIEDIQLLQPTLYLPALAPQYLPTVLLSLMDGEEIPWSNYVDYEVISAEDRTTAKSYMISIGRICWFDGFKLPRFSDLRISLSNCVDDVLKRLNSYDCPKDAPPVPVFEDIIPVCPAIMLVDVPSMKHGLEPHFKQLREFSKSFSLQISQIMALNCSYWESLPELYLNSPAEMVVNARCSGRSGGRSWENCSGPARVVFKYTEAKLNENLGHSIHQNRIEYQTALDEKGTKPPPSVVCIAAVVIEDFITNLVVSYRRTSLEGEERLKVAAVGSELFYYAATLVSSDTDFYPPTRQLLSSLLEVLGREFISTLPNQCHRLVTTSIRNPKLVGSLAPHLTLASCSPSMINDIYREVASIPRRNVDLAFVILTKFDINNWLRNAKPKLNERSQLLQIMWKALTADGFAPEEDRLMVHDTYRNHFRNMLIYDFPQHYGEILEKLLDGSQQNNITPQVWYDFCNGLSRDTIRFSYGMDGFLRKREAKRFATEANMLGYQELLGTAQLLARHFTDERLSNGLYGLYSKYRNYIEPLSCFLQMVAYSVTAYTLTNSKGTLSQNIVDAVWPLIRDLYAPWMLPYNHKFIQQNCAQWIQHMNFDSTSVLQPFIAADSQLAMIIVNDFTDCLMFLVETLPGNSVIFSYLWNFYVENFAFIGVKEHVLGVVHNCFVSIPWAMYWPSFTDVELMCKVVEKFLPASHSFLSIVFAQISWHEWINSLNPKFIGKGHGMLLNLTIRLGNDTVARESPTWLKVMETAETRMNWLAISPNGLEPILNWLVMSIDPRVVLNLDLTHRMDKALLRLLETACGYGHPEHLSNNSSCNSIELNTKRYCFVRSYVRLIVSASSKHKNLLETQPKSFEDAISNMITELATSVKRENQSSDFFMSHLRELLGLMSNHTLGTIARNAVLEWCSSQTESHSLIFLTTLVQLSCGVKVRPYIVCPLVEAAINLCFQYPDVSWSSIRDLVVVNPEELSNFFDIASKDGHYLVLHSLLLRRFSVFIGGGIDTLCLFMDLLKNIKPKESNEEALSLIYDEILKVVTQLHLDEALSHDATNETVLKHEKKFLLQFAQHASLIGDDKQGWGLLGALGIGKSSQLSVRGRLFAKLLGTFVFAQLPISSPVRIDPDSEGHFLQVASNLESAIKPHPEVSSCLEKLESLKQNRQHTDLIECIDFATAFIKDPNNALSSSSLFISKLNGYLFSSRFLTRS